MKKILFFAAALVAMSMATVSCTGSKTDAADTDSIAADTCLCDSVEALEADSLVDSVSVVETAEPVVAE